MLPNFLIIGSAKAGTTSLFGYLRLHPEIHMSPHKEPHFFAPPDAESQLTIPRVGDRASYEALFESDAPLRGEASTSYSEWPRIPEVPKRIHGLISEAKLIYLVRDPIERIRALYVQRAARTNVGPFRQALGNIKDPFNFWVAGSRYMLQIERYLEYFSKDRLLVLDQAELHSSRRDVLRAVFEFLGVDASFWSPRFDGELNVAVRRRRYSHAYRALAHSQAVRTVVRQLPPGVQRTAIRATARMMRPPLGKPVVDSELRLQLNEYLAGEVDRLREFTGKEFATWSI